MTSKVSVLTLALAALLVFSSQTLAAPPASHPGNSVMATSASQSAGGGLQGGQLQACLARENAIKQRSTHLADLATGMEAKFSTIASRVESYYKAKVIPSGKSVSNYTSLVADIQKDKAVVDTALSKASADATGFSCSSGNPKGQLTQYRIDMQSVIKDLKIYRTAIKNLIVAVHSVVGTTNSSQNQSSNSGQSNGGGK